MLRGWFFANLNASMSPHCWFDCIGSQWNSESLTRLPHLPSESGTMLFLSTCLNFSLLRKKLAMACEHVQVKRNAWYHPHGQGIKQQIGVCFPSSPQRSGMGSPQQYATQNRFHLLRRDWRRICSERRLAMFDIWYLSRSLCLVIVPVALDRVCKWIECLWENVVIIIIINVRFYFIYLCSNLLWSLSIDWRRLRFGDLMYYFVCLFIYWFSAGLMCYVRMNIAIDPSIWLVSFFLIDSRSFYVFFLKCFKSIKRKIFIYLCKF